MCTDLEDRRGPLAAIADGSLMEEGVHSHLPRKSMSVTISCLAEGSLCCFYVTICRPTSRMPAAGNSALAVGRNKCDMQCCHVEEGTASLWPIDASQVMVLMALHVFGEKDEVASLSLNLQRAFC